MATKTKKPRSSRRREVSEPPASTVKLSEEAVIKGAGLRAMVLGEGKNPVALALAIGLITTEDIADYLTSVLRVVGASSWTYSGKRA